MLIPSCYRVESIFREAVLTVEKSISDEEKEELKEYPTAQLMVESIQHEIRAITNPPEAQIY